MKTIRTFIFPTFFPTVAFVFACTLSHLSAAPIWEWVKSVPANGNAPQGIWSGVTVDRDGNVYWSGNASSGNLGPTSVSNDSLFLSKLSPSGIFQWSKLSPANGQLIGSTLTSDSH